MVYIATSQKRKKDFLRWSFGGSKGVVCFHLCFSYPHTAITDNFTYVNDLMPFDLQ